MATVDTETLLDIGEELGITLEEAERLMALIVRTATTRINLSQTQIIESIEKRFRTDYRVTVESVRKLHQDLTSGEGTLTAASTGTILRAFKGSARTIPPRQSCWGCGYDWHDAVRADPHHPLRHWGASGLTPHYHKGENIRVCPACYEDLTAGQEEMDD